MSSASLAVRLAFENVRTLAFGALGPAYMGIGTAMSKPIRMMILMNLTDTAVMFSDDGINDKIPMPPNGYIVLDITSNKTINQGFFLAEGSRMYARQLGAVPTTGSIYLSVIYGAEVA